MTEFAKQVLPVALESEMRESYLAYAMSVIVGRALPDVRLDPGRSDRLDALGEHRSGGLPRHHGGARGPRYRGHLRL